MCKFCDLLKNGGDMIWEERSTFADDNLCEFASVGGEHRMCDGCSGCKGRGFKLSSYKQGGNAKLSVSYFRKAFDIEVSPFSESLPISFCPFCGEQVSENVEEFNENDFRYSIK